MSWRRVLRVAAVFAGLAIAWWLFGWSTGITPLGKITLRRYFGRVTRIDCSTRVNGKLVRERILFPWSEPFVRGEPITSCAAIMPERWQDRNGDGRWDTWLRRVGPDGSGECHVEYLVDTLGSGKPDWSFVMSYRDFEKADAMIKERRGF